MCEDFKKMIQVLLCRIISALLFVFHGSLIIVFICGAPAIANEHITKTVFPIGELFEPLVADVKEAQFSTGLHQTNSSGQLGHFTAAVVSYGESFGLMRWQTTSGHQWQLSLTGAIFAQFNMDSPSWDLINADYAIGLSTTHRRGAVSYRLLGLHQSTHLGDEYLLSEASPERINFSMEFLEGLVSYEWSMWRIYGGGAYLLHIEPSSVDNIALQYGMEFHDTQSRLFNGRWIGGVNLSMFEGNNWKPDITAKVGLEFGRPGSGNRRIRVMLEGYKGHSPFGQFFDVRITSYGLSIYLGY